MSERRFDRGAWLTLAFVIAFGVLAIGSTVYTLAMPGDGWTRPYPNGDEATPLEFYYGDWQTPLQAGDLVLRVDGIDVSQSATQAIVNPAVTWQSGATVLYTLDRDRTTMEVPVTLEQASAAGILSAVWHAMQDSPAEWSWGLIAVVVFFVRPRNPAARVLLIMGVSHNIVTKIVWAGETTSFYFAPPVVFYVRSLANQFWAILFIPSIILLAQSFPLRTFPFARYPRLVTALLYGLPVVGVLLFYATQDENLANGILIVEAILMLLALGATIVHARRERHDAQVRAQATWLALGFGLSFGIILPFYLLEASGIVDPNAMEGGVWVLLQVIPTLMLPLCLGIAITRYHLFDISVIVRRTLTYGLVTVILLLVFFGSVVVLQQVFAAVVGHAENELVTVVSTLVIAALFIPLRNRIQDVIDRRFNRKKYDAEKVLSRFATTVRDETDLEKLSNELVDVVNETMEPVSVSLWLKKEARK